jgi:hypothetical protein
LSYSFGYWARPATNNLKIQVFETEGKIFCYNFYLDTLIRKSLIIEKLTDGLCVKLVGLAPDRVLRHGAQEMLTLCFVYYMSDVILMEKCTDIQWPLTRYSG